MLVLTNDNSLKIDMCLIFYLSKEKLYLSKLNVKYTLHYDKNTLHQ